MKSKYMKRIMFLAAAALTISSCDSFLDTSPEDLRSPEQIYETYSSTQNAMFGVYSYIRDTYPFNMPDTYSTSDVDVAYTNVHTFDMGVWSASSAQYDKWYTFYKAIREATYFLQNVDKCPDPRLTYDTREQWKAEIRCVRAYYYAQLMRMYGPVILLKDEQPDFSGTDMFRERNTWDECVQWITEEFTDLIENSPLPLKSEGETYARMNRGIAKAYLARILLQSASPQFNGNSKYANIRNADGTPLFPLTYDKNKWELARQAALSLIKDGNYDLVKVLYESGANMGEIDPYTSYKSVFTTSQNKEMIFSFLEDNGTIDKRLAPNSNGGWGGGYNPTQEIVDAYAMLETGRFPITGYTDDDRTTPIIDPDAGYQEVGYSQFTKPCEGKERKTYNMFVGREPRFYVSIVYGGMSWFIPKKASEKIYLEMYKNGNNGPDASHNHFTTGYNMVKLAMPEYEASPTKNVKRELPYIRYAEILLNYVEATIELGELKDPNLLTYWNAVRNRAGLKNIEEAYPEAMNDQDKLRDLIHRERRVEFAFEGINFYDSRRWLTAEETEKGDIHGMNIQAKGTPGKEEYPEDFFQRTVIEKRVFTPSFYLFPIPQSAINKNQDLVQIYKFFICGSFIGDFLY